MKFAFISLNSRRNGFCVRRLPFVRKLWNFCRRSLIINVCVSVYCVCIDVGRRLCAFGIEINLRSFFMTNQIKRTELHFPYSFGMRFRAHRRIEDVTITITILAVRIISRIQTTPCHANPRSPDGWWWANHQFRFGSRCSRTVNGRLGWMILFAGQKKNNLENPRMGHRRQPYSTANGVANESYIVWIESKSI